MSAATISAPMGSQPVTRRGYWRGMLWLTWRQHRWQILVAAVVIVGTVIWMMTTAAEIESGIRLCPPSGCATRVLDNARGTKLSHGYSFATYELNTVTFLPVLAGVFLGVPLLAREYEQRTLTLAWSQDVSPLKWLWGKLAILGAVVAALGTALAGEAVRLAHLAHIADHRSLFEGTLFQAGGWMPLTLALAWFMVGVAAGTVLRRTLPAFAVVLGAFIGRTVLMAQQRPNLMTPVTDLKPIDSSGIEVDIRRGDISEVPNTMMLNSGNGPYVDSKGIAHNSMQVRDQWCGSVPQDKDGAFLDCLNKHDLVGIQQSYHPASRLGTFHLIENGLNLSLLIVSLAVTWWFIRRARTAP